MTLEKGTSAYSSPALKNSRNLATNSSWILCVSRCFSSAFERVTLRHSAGGCSRCRLRESVRAQKIPAEVAEVDRQRVLLRRVAVPRVVIPRFEHRVGTTPALDLTNRPTFPVGLCGSEERLAPNLELFRELKVLDHFLLLSLSLSLLLHWFLLHTPLDPN